METAQATGSKRNCLGEQRAAARVGGKVGVVVEDNCWRKVQEEEHLEVLQQTGRDLQLSKVGF